MEVGMGVGVRVGGTINVGEVTGTGVTWDSREKFIPFPKISQPAMQSNRSRAPASATRIPTCEPVIPKYFFERVIDPPRRTVVQVSYPPTSYPDRFNIMTEKTNRWAVEKAHYTIDPYGLGVSTRVGMSIGVKVGVTVGVGVSIKGIQPL